MQQPGIDRLGGYNDPMEEESELSHDDDDVDDALTVELEVPRTHRRSDQEVFDIVIEWRSARFTWVDIII